MPLVCQDRHFMVRIAAIFLWLLWSVSLFAQVSSVPSVDGYSNNTAYLRLRLRPREFTSQSIAASYYSGALLTVERHLVTSMLFENQAQSASFLALGGRANLTSIATVYGSVGGAFTSRLSAYGYLLLKTNVTESVLVDTFVQRTPLASEVPLPSAARHFLQDSLGIQVHGGKNFRWLSWLDRTDFFSWHENHQFEVFNDYSLTNTQSVLPQVTLSTSRAPKPYPFESLAKNEHSVSVSTSYSQTLRHGWRFAIRPWIGKSWGKTFADATTISDHVQIDGELNVGCSQALCGYVKIHAKKEWFQNSFDTAPTDYSMMAGVSGTR